MAQSSTTTLSDGAARGPALRTWALLLLLGINLFNYIDRYILSAVEPDLEREFFPGEKTAESSSSSPPAKIADTPAAGEAASEPPKKIELIDPSARGKIGLLATAFLVSYMLTAPVFGWLADRISRWLLISVGVALWSVASAGSGWALGFTMLLVTRMFVGVGEAAYGPAAPTLISDMYPIERRGRVLSWFYMAIPVGSALGFGLGGWVAAHWGWRTAFYCVAPPGLALSVLCLLLRDPRGHTNLPAAPVQRAHFADYLVLLRTPSYVFNTLGMTAMTFALGGVAFWMPSYVHVFRKEPDLATVNIVFGAITVLSGLTATLLGGLVGDRLRTRFPGSYFLVSGAAMLIGLPLFLLVLVVPFRPFPWAWICIFLAEFCLFFNTGPTNTILANVTHPLVRSTAFAVNIFFIHLLGDAISPPLIGWVTDRADGNMNAGFLCVSVAILISGLFWLAGTRFLERDTQLAPTRLAALPESNVAS